MTVKKKQYQKWAFGEIFFTISAIFLLLLLLKNPELAADAVSSALLQCAKLLIPSLFPIMVASEIAVESGAAEFITRPLNGLLARILGVKKEAASPYFLGLLGGYTTSVCGILSLYKNGKISKEDCERMVALSSLPSLSFLTGFAGNGIFKSTTIGWILWAISIFSTLILGFFTQKRHKKGKLTAGRIHPVMRDENSKKAISKSAISASKIIVGAISHSAGAMIVICGCVVFFSTLIAVLHCPIDALNMPENIQNLALGSLEITNGISSTASISPLSLRAASCGFFIGWSGLSVHFQIISLCDGYDLSFKKYFLYKAIQGAICCLVSWIVFM